MCISSCLLWVCCLHLLKHSDMHDLEWIMISVERLYSDMHDLEWIMISVELFNSDMHDLEWIMLSVELLYSDMHDLEWIMISVELFSSDMHDLEWIMLSVELLYSDMHNLEWIMTSVELLELNQHDCIFGMQLLVVVCAGPEIQSRDRVCLCINVCFEGHITKALECKVTSAKETPLFCVPPPCPVFSLLFDGRNTQGELLIKAAHHTTTSDHSPRSSQGRKFNPGMLVGACNHAAVCVKSFVCFWHHHTQAAVESPEQFVSRALCVFGTTTHRRPLNRRSSLCQELCVFLAPPHTGGR